MLQTERASNDHRGSSASATSGRCIGLIDHSTYLLTAAIYETDAGRELRAGFSENNLMRSELVTQGDASLLEQAENMRLLFLGTRVDQIARH